MDLKYLIQQQQKPQKEQRQHERQPQQHAPHQQQPVLQQQQQLLDLQLDLQLVTERQPRHNQLQQQQHSI